VPGLETTLSLLLTAEKEGKLTREKLLDLCHNRPASIFGITDNSQIEVSLEDRQIANEELQTKAGWSPFHGQIVVGSVQKVTLDSTVVLEDGNIVARSGSGRVLTSSAV
jgi:dihydroorotase-like cyclic amidohydrolase